jgi:hypothetical protein
MELSDGQAAYRAACAAYDTHAAKLGSYNPDGTPNVAFVNESFRLSAVAFEAMQALAPPSEALPT